MFKLFAIFILLAVAVNSMPSEMLRNPEEVAGEFEGDIILTEADFSRLGRSGILDLTKRWTKNSYKQVVIPYAFRAASPYTAYELDLIKISMEEIQKNTCIRFTPRTTEYNYIEIYSGGGCSSQVGMVGGRQLVSLDAQVGSTHCMVKGIIMHELIHALGFFHMHSSSDRDGFVKINYDNIIWGLSYAFDKYTTSNFGTTYDLESVMHYTSTSFSKNGKATIEPYDLTYIPKMGQRVRLSEGDVTRINNMYAC